MSTRFAHTTAIVMAQMITVNTIALAKEVDPYYQFIGTCDASATVPLEKKRFVVAGDELSILKVYDWNSPGDGQSIDLTKIIPSIKPDHELDLEAAAMIGDKSYWISSHSRSKRGKLALDRHIFFALKFEKQNSKIKAIPVGKPYKNLLEDLTKDKRYKRYNFENFKKKFASDRAGESTKGFNIEGLSTWKKKQLLIGLRGPLIDNKAVLIPLKNPAAVVNGNRPKFGKMIKLDLDGNGIRGIEYIPKLGKYAILGGSVGKHQSCNVYMWSGQKSDTKPPKVPNLKFYDKFNPESVFYLPQSDSVFILSDDGNQKYHGLKCKDLEEQGKVVFFRGHELKKDEVRKAN